MKKFLLLCLCIIQCLSSFSEKRALVIGVGHYPKDSGWQEISSANDIDLLKEAGKNLLTMMAISLFASCLYFLITPLNLSNPTELLARTNPTIYDVLIALFGGSAGIFEQ